MTATSYELILPHGAHHGLFAAFPDEAGRINGISSPNCQPCCSRTSHPKTEGSASPCLPSCASGSGWDFKVRLHRRSPGVSRVAHSHHAVSLPVSLAIQRSQRGPNRAAGFQGGTTKVARPLDLRALGWQPGGETSLHAASVQENRFSLWMEGAACGPRAEAFLPPPGNGAHSVDNLPKCSLCNFMTLLNQWLILHASRCLVLYVSAS